MKNFLINTFKQNTISLKNMLSSFNNEDMFLSTGNSNTIGWIFGHIIYERGIIIKVFNKEFEIPEKENVFQRGAPKNKTIAVDMEEFLKVFVERGEQIISEINKAGDEGLKKNFPGKHPFGGDDVESLLHFLSWHETFHLGQIDLIKAATGKGGMK